jgi:hypothetical protein
VGGKVGGKAGDGLRTWYLRSLRSLPVSWSHTSMNPSMLPVPLHSFSTRRHALLLQYTPPCPAPSVHAAMPCSFSTRRHALLLQYTPPCPAPSVYAAMPCSFSTRRHALLLQYTPPCPAPRLQGAPLHQPLDAACPHILATRPAPTASLHASPLLPTLAGSWRGD